MKKITFVLFTILIFSKINFTQDKMSGLRGDPEAIAEAEAMVKTMGGMEIWSQLKSVHFVHEWRIWNRIDSYIENEILDLTGPRSWVEMKSEIYHRLRAYSPENKYWNIVNGEFSYASEESLSASLERAPYHFCRIARAIATGDSDYEVRFGKGEFRNSKQLEFFGPDGIRHGYILLNEKKEPILWGTTQYSYIFGPMKRFGNLRVPAWGVTGNGAVTYEMISLTGSTRQVDTALFIPPQKYVNNSFK